MVLTKFVPRLLIILLFAVQASAISQNTPNPDRGFYQQFDTVSSNHQPLSTQTESLTAIRDDQGIRLILRIWYLDNFTSSNITARCLEQINDDFSTLRALGLKAVIRFGYSLPGVTQPNENPPYHDAPLSVSLTHIQQLGPVLRSNLDVITAVQAGFIGLWGEWHYSDYYVAGADFTARKQLTDTLSAALQYRRRVQVRTPGYKQGMYGTAPLNQTAGPDGAASPAANVGHHNDCFLASATDYGTYPDGSRVLYPYLSQDTRYTGMGGETCNLNPPRSNCLQALQELELFHYTYLNAGYQEQVLNNWKSEGCYDTIAVSLGYQLWLQNITLPLALRRQDEFVVDFVVANLGYSAPLYPRGVELGLRRMDTGAVCVAALATSVYNLASLHPDLQNGTYPSGNVSLRLPANLSLGHYEWLLRLPDSSDSLKLRPEYAIQLANDELAFEPASGWHRLGSILLLEEAAKPAASLAGPVHLFDCNSGLPGTANGTGGYIVNPYFEDDTGWLAYGTLPVSYSTQQSHHGNRSLYLLGNSSVKQRGVKQLISMTPPRTVRNITMSAWSRHNGATGGYGNYGLYVDLAYSDGTSLYGQLAPFDPAVSDTWQFATSTFMPDANKQVSSLYFYIMFRSQPGQAWFDDVKILLDGWDTGLRCPSGYFERGGGCLLCPAGFSCLAGQLAACSANAYSLVGELNCTSCACGYGMCPSRTSPLCQCDNGDYAYHCLTPAQSSTPSAPSASASPSASLSRSVAPSSTPSASPSPSVSLSRSASISLSRSITASISLSRSITVTPSSTPSASLSPSVSLSRSASISLSRSITASLSLSPSRSGNPSTSRSRTGTPSTSPSRTGNPSTSRSRTGTPSTSPSRTASISRSRSTTASISRSRSITVSSSRSPSRSVVTGRRRQS